MADLTEFERGMLIGVLIGEGSFGGDGRQPQVTVRMHTRHAALFEWLAARIPGSRIYGPYHHGGRSYLQWMVRGSPLVHELLPLLEVEPLPQLDGHAATRLQAMLDRYGPFIERERARGADAVE